MARGLIFDYGGTLDTKGCHWGKVLWHAYEQSHVPVGEEAFRNAYVHGERTLATNRIITPHITTPYSRRHTPWQKGIPQNRQKSSRCWLQNTRWCW